ncbi:glycosyltransferase family 4 protein [Formosa sp. PL04]|uniref:glycosyltransferase family 4 protein n=1 Tax=Formosa sp. PL04 TaxID=3081755 RepID=UPI002981C57C|nr:glycosyltransferase family 4 protein [Formosa sp. PL04]MDW5290734.1 glycosyltransferase family 4 protein [Formosa sp. PL04]
MKIKHILIVTSEFPPQPGGIGNHAYYLALYLYKNDYTVTVIADQRDVINVEELAFDANLPFRVERIALKTPRLGMYFNRVVKTMNAFKKADYVIATGKFSLWNVAFCSRFYNRKTLAVIHGTEVNFKNGYLKKAVDLALNRFGTIVAVSNYTSQLVSHLEKDVTVIPNGIEIAQWEAEGLTPARLKGYPVLTTVGRVSTRKGQLQVISHLPELIKTFPDVHYHCIGIPTEADAFMAQAKSLSVDSYITFHGVVDAKILKEMLMATDVFVMLSTESTTGDVEGFGIAILEANALGIPSIGSKDCGIEDAILDGKSGFLIERDNTLAFEAALFGILEHPEVFKKEAVSWAKTHSWNAIIKRYIKVIAS